MMQTLKHFNFIHICFFTSKLQQILNRQILNTQVRRKAVQDFHQQRFVEPHAAWKLVQMDAGQRKRGDELREDVRAGEEAFCRQRPPQE